MNEMNLNGMDSISETPKSISRRKLFEIAGLGAAGVVGLCVVGSPLASIATVSAQTTSGTPRQVMVEKAKGLVIAIPTRCVGCRRCELACTEFNDGEAQPSVARIKVGRNYSFGPTGAKVGWSRGQGNYGDALIVQDTCKQCPHPVPCMLACPKGAIEVVAPVNARVVNQDKCTGCRICQQACPWEMTSFDEEIKKSTKCHLCAGAPECVKACPAGALQYIPWTDMTKVVPPRFVVPGYIGLATDTKDTCAKCH